ncbi:unnamed protein product, partial [Prorocentrum cordatum]
RTARRSGASAGGAERGCRQRRRHGRARAPHAAASGEPVPAEARDGRRAALLPASTPRSAISSPRRARWRHAAQAPEAPPHQWPRHDVAPRGRPVQRRQRLPAGAALGADGEEGHGGLADDMRRLRAGGRVHRT